MTLKITRLLLFSYIFCFLGSNISAETHASKNYILAGIYAHTAHDVTLATAEGKELRFHAPQSRFIKTNAVIPVHDITNYLTQALAHSIDYQPTPIVTLTVGDKIYLFWIDQRGLVCHRKFIAGTMTRDQAFTRVLCPLTDSSSQIFLSMDDETIHASCQMAAKGSRVKS
jgi:hypothetical protein